MTEGTQMTKSPGLPLTRVKIEELRTLAESHNFGGLPVPILCDQANAALTLKDERDKLAAELDKFYLEAPSEQLTHGMNCGVRGFAFGCDSECTCCLRYRIETQTAQTMYAAWRKRATEAEAKLAAQSADAARLDWVLTKLAAGESVEFDPTNIRRGIAPYTVMNTPELIKAGLRDAIDAALSAPEGT